MTDRDRLIDLIVQAERKCSEETCEYCEYTNYDNTLCDTYNLADYLLANGAFLLPEDLRGTQDFSISAFIEAMQMYKEKDRYIKLPCKVGDKVYYPYEYGNKVLEKTVIKIVIEKEDRWLDVGVSFLPFENIGKTVFLTKEEAERKLRKEDEGK